MWSAVKGANFPNWRIITGGRDCVLHEPITSIVRFDNFNFKECRGAFRNVMLVYISIRYLLN